MPKNIRWKRIYRVSQGILRYYKINTSLQIHLTTALDARIRGNVQGDRENGFDMLLNANENKGEAEIIKTVSHELAHIVLGNNHGDGHVGKTKEIENIFKKRMKKGGL